MFPPRQEEHPGGAELPIAGAKLVDTLELPGLWSINSSVSEDSDMAQYSGRRRRKKPLSPNAFPVNCAGFEHIKILCSHPSRPTIEGDTTISDLVSQTKKILPKWQLHVNLLKPPVKSLSQEGESATLAEENVEIEEEDTLRHDYDLARV